MPNKEYIMKSLADSMGLPTDDPIIAIRRKLIRFGARVDREGMEMSDIRFFRTGCTEERHYMANAVYVVALEAEDLDFILDVEYLLIRQGRNGVKGLGVHAMALDCIIASVPSQAPCTNGKTDNMCQRVIIEPPIAALMKHSAYNVISGRRYKLVRKSQFEPETLPLSFGE